MNETQEQELNDILIKREDSSAARIKNLLMVTGALMLMVIISVLIYRIVENSVADDPLEGMPNGGEGDSMMFEVPQPQVVPPEVEQQSALDEIIARHREQREGASSNTSSATSAQLPPPATPKTPAVNPAPPATVTTPKEPTTTAIKQPTPSQPKQPPAATPQAGLFYVQVESLTKAPTQEYLRVLRARGYGISVKEKRIDGKSVHRIYIGPYKNRDEAVSALPNIKRDYNPDAFIVQE
ncbi:MAG: SPOR domain-containing protein [Helicobacteraceae bacterium]|nr:SPOR domain-containing protein [Helicobacteraceae bacterium]